MSNETKGKSNGPDVDAIRAETAAKLQATKDRIAEVRTVLVTARNERDTAIENAEKAYSDAYDASFTAQRNELRSLDEAYSAMRDEVVQRWTVESQALAESRDVAVSAANSLYEDTQNAAKQTFGDS